MEKIKYFIGFCIVTAFVGIFTNVFAQTTTSTIEGTVTDQNGAVVAGATVTATGSNLAAERSAVTDSQGFYRLVALPAGTYKVTFTQTGFANRVVNFELTLNRIAKIDTVLGVAGDVGGEVSVTGDVPLIEPNASSTGSTITPRQIQDFPVNGREYLDLLQLVPGVAINRQSDGDNANPVLGERSGNNNFFIDGQPNKDTVNGGPAAQFNQETIAEFQVLTTGFKAEFGQASGAIVNVITKSGGNGYHGVASFFHRNEAFDSSNSLTPNTDPVHLRRFNYSFAVGGPVINPGFGEGTKFFRPLKDKVFFFASSERITQDKGIDFNYPDLGNSAGAATVLQLLRAQENPYDRPERMEATRNFIKFNENLGRHQLVQEMNYTNEFTRGSGQGLPSTRRNSSGRNLLLAVGDTMLLGDLGNPWIVDLRGSYRSEPSDNGPSNPGVVGVTSLNAFTAQQPCPPTCGFFGDLPSVTFGSATTGSNLFQKYTSLSANVNRRFGDHNFKFGWQYLRTKVDGLDSNTLTNQLFTTVDDFVTYGAINAGPILLLNAGSPTEAGKQIHIKNDYNALYVQDDWKIFRNLTLNLGLRYDRDSEFEAKKNFSPRLGVAWAITPKTVLRSSFGIFYDQFRLGLVRNIPAFGGSDRRIGQSLYYPRGYYGSPSAISMIGYVVGLPGQPCISNHLTDAQIIAGSIPCPVRGGPMIGVDRLNNVVTLGHAPIPANAVLNISNVQALTGYTPEQYLVAAAAAIGQPSGYFNWGEFGVLNNPIIAASAQPTTVDSTFSTPNTLGFNVGIQRELGNGMAIEVDYFHRRMRNLLGVRLSNLAFRSRVTGRSFDPPGSPETQTFGPFYKGRYDALIVNFNKRFNDRYALGANYTYAKATDNSRGIFAGPTDNFIGIAPVVTEPCPASDPGCTPQTNANGSFIARNGNFVAAAGTFVNGPDLDKGPSDLALDHIFQVNGLVELPWKFQVSGIFRVQSGFHFSRFDEPPRDPDGNGNFSGVDFTAGRNAFTAAPFVNLDLRLSKRFVFRERYKFQVLFELFNVLNRQNPASVQNRENVLTEPFGSTNQVLFGREGQVGFRFEF